MIYKNRSIQISCDGGAATGKSTGAKMIAKKYSNIATLFLRVLKKNMSKDKCTQAPNISIIAISN